VTVQSSTQAESFILLGTVTKPHGIRGELKVRPYTETSGNFIHYRQLYLSAEDGQSKVPYTKVQARTSGNAVLLKLKEVETRDQAEQHAGMQIWVPCSELPEVKEDEFYLYTLEGKQAYTKDGLPLGTVSGLLCTSGQDIMVIQASQDEFLVPVVREFIVVIDQEKVILDLPPGLLDINR
jgi:16S rRNA processing protein RimM